MQMIVSQSIVSMCLTALELPSEQLRPVFVCGCNRKYNSRDTLAKNESISPKRQTPCTCPAPS